MSVFRDFGNSARSHRAPVTVGIVAVLVLAFLVQWVSNQSSLPAMLGFFSLDAASKPWTLLTYPAAAVDDRLISYLFAWLWLWGIGGQVERDLGATKFLATFLTCTVLCALGLWLGAGILSLPAYLFGAWAPIAAITVIWGVRNPNAPMTIFFVLPITGKWLAWLSAVLLFFDTRPPQLAPFAALPLLLAYLFAADRLPFARYAGGSRRNRGENPVGARRVYKKQYYEDVKRREQSRQEKERLRELFERSMIDDPEDRK